MYQRVCNKNNDFFLSFAVTSLYLSDTGTISDKYDTLITPAGWTFTIWAFIYTWQVVHVIYSLTLLCRKTSSGHYLYVYPAHIHFSFYIVFMINNAINTGWIFLFDREMLIVSFIFLIGISVAIYVGAVLLCRSLNQAGDVLEKSGNVKDIWMTRLFTLNGLAFYGTWCTIATLLNMVIVMQYVSGVDRYVCVWVALGIVTLELICWFILETFVFDRHLRYCFSPYIVLLIAFLGVLSKNYKPEAPDMYIYYVFFLIALSALLAIVKVTVMIVRGCRTPIKYSNSQVEPTLSLTKEQEANAIPL